MRTIGISMKKQLEKIKKSISALLWQRFRKNAKQQEQVNSKEVQVKELLQSLHVIMSIVDDSLKKKKYCRAERRHFWEDFRKSQKFRAEIFQELIESENIDKLLHDRKERVCIEKGVKQHG